MLKKVVVIEENKYVWQIALWYGNGLYAEKFFEDTCTINLIRAVDQFIQEQDPRWQLHIDNHNRPQARRAKS